MKINKKISVQQFLPLSEAEIHCLLHPAEANLGYFLAWFQSLQLPSTQSESPLALIPLSAKCHVAFSVFLLLFIKTANGLLTRWQLYYSKTQQAMKHITEKTATLKQNTAHRTTQAIKDTKYSASHYRYIINNEKQVCNNYGM
jgi:hypothetical protein